MKTTTNWMLVAAAAALSAAGVQAQVATVTPHQIAADIEASAAELDGRIDQWADAATLYVAAAELRDDADPRAQRDLFAAANLFLRTGNVGGAIDALESAGARALASGDRELARERFADAALVAQRAGLSREHQRLSYRTTEVAMATGLGAAERR